MSIRKLPIAFLVAVSLSAQTTVDVVKVVSKVVDRQVNLPGEFLPYLRVPIQAKVTGFVDKVYVDRGSMVKEGQVLVTLVAPEMKAQVAEAESKMQALKLQQAEAEAKAAGVRSTYQKMKSASATPGVVAGNDLVVAQKNADAAEALVHAFDGSIRSAQANVQALKDLESYLTIRAPFSGIITERLIHPGALVGPESGSASKPLLMLEQSSHLRLVVAVPEAVVGGIVNGATVCFTVPAYPGKSFSGVISRISHSLDEKTRTMPVELDVKNPALQLAPGMYPQVTWPVRRPHPALLVPAASIVTTNERTFVIRVKNGTTEWVNVNRGPTAGNLVEVYGSLKPGDLVVRHGTDELRPNTRVGVRIRGA